MHISFGITQRRPKQ